MREPAYIAIAADGHLTLFWGDGTEAEKIPILRGPRAVPGRALVEMIEELRQWAEDNGYTVIVPAYDLEVPPDVEIDLPEQEAETLDYQDVDSLLNELYDAGEYGRDAGSEDAANDEDYPPGGDGEY